MSKKQKVIADRLVKEYNHEKDGDKQQYAMREISNLSKEDLLELKFQYEATTNTTISWTWMIAIYGALFTLLIEHIVAIGFENNSIHVVVGLFLIAIAGASLITIKIHKIFSAQKYLLGHINNRLEVLNEGEKSRRCLENHYTERIECKDVVELVNTLCEKERKEISRRIGQKMIEDNVLSDKKIKEYIGMDIEEIVKKDK